MRKLNHKIDMNKTYKIIVGVACLFTQKVAFSQDSNVMDEKTIVMTEDDLTQLVETIIQHKRENSIVNYIFI